MIMKPTGRTHDLNRSGSVEKKASTSQDMNEGCCLAQNSITACHVDAKLVPYSCYHL